VKARGFTGAVDRERVVAAIRAAESRSTGEVRVHVTSQAVDDVHAAAVATFEKLGMTATRERNGVLLFIAPLSRKFAVIGDTGIHTRCGPAFWSELAGAVAEDFRAERFTEGIVKGLTRAADILAQHFPRSADRPDTNELPDEVSED
jgi:uncharacterized membrane protein